MIYVDGAEQSAPPAGGVMLVLVRGIILNTQPRENKAQL